MHLLAIVLIPDEADRAGTLPPAAASANAWARIDTLLFPYEEPATQAWGVRFGAGFKFDYWIIGGRWEGWGRRIRGLLRKQHGTPVRKSIPRVLARNAVWSEDLSRVRLNSSRSLYPLAVVTPYGEWVDASMHLPIFGKPTKRQRNSELAWLRRVRKIANRFPGSLAVAVDYHS